MNSDIYRVHDLKFFSANIIAFAEKAPADFGPEAKCVNGTSRPSPHPHLPAFGEDVSSFDGAA